MSSYVEVMAIVEGKTEQIFIEKLLNPYLLNKNIFIKATQVSKPGQKGGDVRFTRVKKDIGIHLKQRPDTYVTTMVDYYGVKEWPAIKDVPSRATPSQISRVVNDAAKRKIIRLFSKYHAEQRFIPFMTIHEFEALLFSNSSAIAKELDVSVEDIDSTLMEFGEPEAINNRPQKSPSKLLNKWSQNREFPKTTTGIAIAGSIGIDTIRKKCPVFNAWLKKFEAIQRNQR